MAFFGLLVVVLGLALSVLWVVGLFDVMRNDFSGNNKILWVFLLLAVPPLGAIFYQLIGKYQKIPRPVPLDTVRRSGGPRL